ncbi:MAG: hypothetical protein M9894_32415 [Planctomycetes bacterium]|nr:hypothetical protein [Planctomycetota bacterium]
MPEDDYVEAGGDGPLQVEPGGRPTRIRLQVNWRPVELREVEVVGGLPIEDAAPPHLVWDTAAGAPTRQEPALLLHRTPLRLLARLRGGRPAGAVRLVCVLEGAGASRTLTTDVDASQLGGDWEAAVETPDPLSDAVAVHELRTRWALEVDGRRTPIHDRPAPLRVYTTHQAPVKNTRFDSPQPHVGKLHLEHACRWADRATENVGQGPRSIAHRVNNEMRHYVHPRDWTAPDQHYASPHAPGDPPPENYDDLPGRVTAGRRPVSSLYYPPLEVTRPYEPYEHYQHNFGWRLLDNPRHTGGRCNQQASLYCEILGVLGIRASVYYLQRVGYGRRTGRPARQYFNCYAGGQFWNFHGIAKVQLADGTYHMYDGSFSSPPNRKNGSEAWAIGERGPFIYSWSPYWLYEDTHERAAEDDWPQTWEGVP